MIPCWRATPVAEEMAGKLRNACEALEIVEPSGEVEVHAIVLRCRPAQRRDLFGEPIGSALTFELLRMIDAGEVALDPDGEAHGLNDAERLWRLVHYRTGFSVQIIVDTGSAPGEAP